MRTPRIFISMGTPYTDAYAAFRDELERLLRDRCKVDPRIIGRNEYPPGSPIHKIAEVMRTCDGVIIVAYERKFVHEGIERRGGQDERKIESATYTTPWNHIESAIAFSLRLPIYIIAQRGLVEEGLIETKVDWYVQKIEFTVQNLQRPEVFDSLEAWITERVSAHAKRNRLALEGFPKLRLLELTVEEWTILITLIVTSFGAGFWLARELPNILPG